VAEDRLVKIRITTKNEGGSESVETLWAVDLGGDRYSLDNSPFYAYNLSWKDVVEARFDEDLGILVPTATVKKSGNRTARILLNDGVDINVDLAPLLQMGCSYEGFRSRLIVVNIPPDTDIDMVTLFLKDRFTWELADPNAM